MWISFNFHTEWKGGNGGSWRSSSWPGEPGSPSVTGRSCCHSVYRRPVPSIPPPLPIQFHQPKVILCTTGPTAYCVKHFGTLLSPKEAVQDSREAKMAIAGRYARIARQHLPPNRSTSPRWVAVTRWSPAADPLLIDTPRHQIATSPIFY